MVSFDVKSLFTNIPASGAFSCVDKRLREFHFTYFKVQELLSFTPTCMSQTTFSTRAMKIWQFRDRFNSCPRSFTYTLQSFTCNILNPHLINNFTFSFRTCYAEDIFTPIDNSLHNLTLPNITLIYLTLCLSIDSNIQFSYFNQSVDHLIPLPPPKKVSEM